MSGYQKISPKNPHRNKTAVASWKTFELRTSQHWRKNSHTAVEKTKKLQKKKNFDARYTTRVVKNSITYPSHDPSWHRDFLDF
jgi:hypothetical protein